MERRKVDSTHLRHRRLAAGALLLAVASAVVGLASGSVEAASATRTAALVPARIGTSNPGFTNINCPVPQNNAYQWHLTLPDSGSTFASVNVTFQNAGAVTTFTPVDEGRHALVLTPGPDTVTGGTALVNGPATSFDLTPDCPCTVDESTTTTTTTPSSTTTTTTTSVGGGGTQVTTSTFAGSVTTAPVVPSSLVPQSTAPDESIAVAAAEATAADATAADAAAAGDTVAVRAAILPVTGAGTGWLMLVAVCLIAAGTWLVRSRRQRRSTGPPPESR